ncbi:phosphohydrolase [Actinoplanes capillaceus]|uniref:Phosphohydrolase n=1 Tax=Actinoplanes campanulatus TaxID=113559 RepID=A0ABQ3WPT9_9ACTN|nr:HD domain-containing protein [Actinoplanes capillaceus]GID48268.1 phosphohydrolase [Actinoplanes capillaceus]
MTPLELAVRGGAVPWPELPSEVVGLLVALGAPARLGAHLRAVYAVARDLTGWLGVAHPAVVFDREAVLFGAATHDIGKVLHPEELSVPGTRHEPAGERLLLERGVPARLARFAGTHGSWHGPRAGVDDRLVSLADKVWKGHRVEDLEQLLVRRIAGVSGIAVWEAFLSLDDRLQELAAGADDRLAFQNGFPV